MKINNSNIKETLDSAKRLLAEEKNISTALRTVLNVLRVFVRVMLERLSITSENSSKPPSQGPNRKKKDKENTSSKRNPGGQPGRMGKQLKPVSGPDKIEVLTIDKRTLPKGHDYYEEGFESRQVVDFDICVLVTEYRAQIRIDEQGHRYVATFPEFVTRPIQYGSKTKATSVYMSQYQLIPYNRIEDYFAAQVSLPISVGSFYNFNQEAYERLEAFEAIAKEKLIASPMVNADETGININGERWWLHTACNEKWTHFFPHQKRGSQAMDEIGILPRFTGVLCHDDWTAYFKYHCQHALCNAHHLRELEWSSIEDNQKWAAVMKRFLLKLNEKVNAEDGKLSVGQCEYYHKKYRKIIQLAEKECPLPNEDAETKKRGRVKKSKSRNLLERLSRHDEEVLRFMHESHVSFTNNQGENDLRMTKVQQKISGCFRSEEGALIFCRVRAYLITCRKH